MHLDGPAHGVERLQPVAGDDEHDALVAVLAELARRGDIDRDERVVLVITGDGLKTLDAVRGAVKIHEIEPALDEFEAILTPALV